VLVQEGKLACPHWNDVVRDELVLVQEGKPTSASFPPWWNDVFQNVLVLMQEKK
jgi:hypothetical protein